MNSIIELIDTAGIENPNTAIESQAQSMRAGQARQADLVVFCFSEDAMGVSTGEVLAATQGIQVWTKCDIGRPQPHELPQAIRTSAATGEGLEELKNLDRPCFAKSRFRRRPCRQHRRALS